MPVIIIIAVVAGKNVKLGDAETAANDRASQYPADQPWGNVLADEGGTRVRANTSISFRNQSQL